MSAFLCSEKHISVLANFAHKNELYLKTVYDYSATNYAADIAEAMAKENIKSVDYRYPDNADSVADELFILNCRDKVHQKIDVEFSPVDIIKLTQCFEYQSCEHDTWKNSSVKSLIDRIKSKAITLLPGYDSAPWGIN